VVAARLSTPGLALEPAEATEHPLE
jgi:hypothetical protein